MTNTKEIKKKNFVERLWNKYQLFIFSELVEKHSLKTVTCLIKVNGKFINESQRLILQNICNKISTPLLLSEPIIYYEELEKTNPETFDKLMIHYSNSL